ncbi:MAG: GNAT family N-acetyltransferase [Butyrivibrio sp.]|nr:GNAT family N-acetyltransferase [Butyrivibrio sp.]
MRIRLFTLKRDQARLFEEEVPESVCENIGKREFFTLCAADTFNEPAGFLQFYVGKLSDGRSVAEIVYVHVREVYRRKGVASRLVSGALSSMEESSIGRVAVFVPKSLEEAQSFFTSAGFIGLAPDADMKEYYERRYGKTGMEEHTLLMRFVGDYDKTVL